MNPTEREELILQKAIEHFCAEGFEGSTRELARKIGVTQSLLYRYFPTKEALIDKVYERVYMSRWNPEWDAWLRDRSVSIEDRLKRYYVDYASIIVQNEWVRILIFAGLKQAGINERLFALLRGKVYQTVVDELHEALALPPPRDAADEEMELELVWGLHASIFYLGMRKWVYQTSVPDDIDGLVQVLVEGFIESIKLYARKRMPSTPEAASQVC
ncbi:MAG: TetR/AcrR family transcriptional regulator [Pigmentiphaga sp.]